MRAILAFHGVDQGPPPLSISPAGFRSLLEGLCEDGVGIVGLEDLLANPTADPSVALTFDDGFESVRDHALPVLQELGVPSIVYVVAGWMGRTNRWPTQPSGAPEHRLLDASAVKELAECGVTIGSHSMDHPILRGLSEATWASEMRGARSRLEDLVGKPVRHFAYPYGVTDPEATRRVREEFVTAVTTRMRYLGPRDDPHLLPRIDAHYCRTGLGRRPFEASGVAWLSLRALLRRMRELVGRP